MCDESMYPSVYGYMSVLTVSTSCALDVDFMCTTHCECDDSVCEYDESGECDDDEWKRDV